MADFNLDARPFFQILHNLIRQDELDYDPEKTARSVEWVRANSGILRKVCSQAEFGCVMAFYAHWDKYKIAPNRRMMDELIHSKTQPKALLDVMEEYDKHSDDLEQVSHMDLDMYLDQRKLDYEKFKLSRTLQIAGDIAIGSVPDPVKKNVNWTGPRDAMKYLQQRFQEGILLDDMASPQGGETAEVGADAVALQISKAATSPGNVIRTATPVDDCLRIGPEQAIRFAAVMASTGHGKSAWLFQTAYIAALARYRVLFVPRECSVESAWMRFLWLHAETMGLQSQLPSLDEALEWGVAKEDHASIIRVIGDDMLARGFRLEVRNPGTWASIKQHVQTIEHDDPYDMVVIDYVAHLPVSGRNERDEYKAIYRECQQLAQDYAGGRGLVIWTAMQTNKQGEDDASEADTLLDRGIYRSVGNIYEHTFAAHDLDLLIGLWSGDGFSEHALTRVSCVKARGKHFPPFFMSRSQHNLNLKVVSDGRAADILAGGFIAQTNHGEPKQLAQEIADLKAFA